MATTAKRYSPAALTLMTWSANGKTHKLYLRASQSADWQSRKAQHEYQHLRDMPEAPTVERIVPKHKRIKPHLGARCAEPVRDMQRRTAIAYCRWLAHRDGIALPKADWRDSEETIRVCYGMVTLPNGKPEMRANAVEFGHMAVTPRDFYQRGRKIISNVYSFVAEVTIAIPHWDFVHPEIVDACEQSEPLPLAA